MINQLSYRPVSERDYTKILYLLQESKFIHRHLDWQHPLDLLNQQPFWVLEDQQGSIVAGLACPPYPVGTAWIHFFGVLQPLKPEVAWGFLFNKVLENCPPPGLQTLAALPTQPWFRRFLPLHGFFHQQDVVILQWSEDAPPESDPPILKCMIRSIYPEDLPVILNLDHQAFAPLWQLSEENLTLAYQDADYATLFLLDGTPVGYMIAGRTHLGGHISRLAVLTDFQSHGIGYRLICDAIRHFIEMGVSLITVNTQSDNLASQALYQKAGFLPTGERLPVYTYHFG